MTERLSKSEYYAALVRLLSAETEFRSRPRHGAMTADTTVQNVRVKYIRPEFRDLKEWMEDPSNLYIGRQGVVFIDKTRFPSRASKWANPFKKGTRAEVCEKFEAYIRKKMKEDPEIFDIRELRGKNLGCWCRPDRCHGDVLLKILREASRD